jgi:hypothetical protein
MGGIRGGVSEVRPKGQNIPRRAGECWRNALQRARKFDAEMGGFKLRFPQGKAAHLDGPAFRRRLVAGTGCAQTFYPFQTHLQDCS